MRVILVATLSVFLFQSCFPRAGEITLVSEFQLLSVKVDPGTEVIDWVWFQGPHRNGLALCVYVNNGRLERYRGEEDPRCKE